MLTIRDLSKSYKSNLILENINLTLNKKSMYFLMGKNGSGKTTLIKCLLGLENYSGEIRFSEEKFDKKKRKVFSIYDDIPLYSDLSGFQNIRLMTPNFEALKIDEIVNWGLLSKQKLKETVKGYSLGERKKLAFIAAIISKPEYLIIDEISNGLDVETLETLKQFLIEQKKQTLIIATGHHFEFYESIIDKLLILNNRSIEHLNNFKQGDNLYEIYKEHISGR